MDGVLSCLNISIKWLEHQNYQVDSKNKWNVIIKNIFENAIIIL